MLLLCDTSCAIILVVGIKNVCLMECVVIMVSDTDYLSNSDARQAVESAGKPMTTFYRYARQGKIGFQGIGRKRRYKKTDVDAYLRGELVQNGRKSNASRVISASTLSTLYEIDIARPDDVPSIFFLESRFEEQERAINPILLNSWLKRNRFLYWILFDSGDRSKVLAVLGVVPFKEDVLQRLLSGEITPNDIKSDDVLIYRSGQRYSVYITSVASERRVSIMPLVHKLFSAWSDASIQVDKVYVTDPYVSEPYALMETPLTQVVTECFFSPYQEEDTRTVWRLWLDRSNAAFPSFIQDYKKIIQEKRGTENMVAVLDRVAPKKIRIGKLKDHSRLQSRYRLNAGGYLASNVRFRPAETYEDVMAAIQINNNLFGKSKDVSDDEFVRHRLTWLEQNPEVIYVLEVRKKIVGFTSLLPLSTSVMNGVLSSKVRMSQIQSDDIQRYIPGKPVDIFVWTVGIDKDIQGQRKRIFGGFMVMGIWHLFNEWGERGIQIRSVYARSDEVDGINISRELGLHPVPPPPGVEKAVFEIHPMDEDNQPFLIQYQRNLENYNSKHSTGVNV